MRPLATLADVEREVVAEYRESGRRQLEVRRQQLADQPGEVFPLRQRQRRSLTLRTELGPVKLTVDYGQESPTQKWHCPQPRAWGLSPPQKITPGRGPRNWASRRRRPRAGGWRWTTPVKGGLILMVQVENEYGSFGSDAEYVDVLRQALLDDGFDVPLYACNPRVRIGNGFRADLFQVANFGPGIWPKAFPMLREHQKTGPLMSGEY